MKKKIPVTPEYLMKFEIAEELGLLEKVRSDGWKHLTSRENGQIGGILAKRNNEFTKK